MTRYERNALRATATASHSAFSLHFALIFNRSIDLFVQLFSDRLPIISLLQKEEALRGYDSTRGEFLLPRHPLCTGENSRNGMSIRPVTSSDFGAFKINLTETKRDRSISIVGIVRRDDRRTSRREEGRGGREKVGVGRPTGFQFLNFRVINLVRHRQRRSVRASGTTIVLIQISPIRSLTFAPLRHASPSRPLSCTLSSCPCV